MLRFAFAEEPAFLSAAHLVADAIDNYLSKLGNGHVPNGGRGKRRGSWRIAGGGLEDI